MSGDGDRAEGLLAGLRARLARRRPLVSVIIPTYNWSSVLRYAVRTVLWQTYRRFEVLVIGDGCTDDSGEIALSFGDPRVRWHNLPRNSGHQSVPNNVALQMARGDYIAYLGHDDVWLPRHLALLLAALERTGADLAYTGCVMLGPPGSRIRILTGISTSGRYEYEPGHGIPPSSLMHRRRMVREIGGWADYRTLRMAPDTEFVLRAHQRGKRFVAVGALTVFKFNSAFRPNSYRERPWREQAEYVRRIETESDFLAREARAIEEDEALGPPTAIPGVSERPDPLPPGWLVDQWRRIRGLEDLGPAAGRAG